MQTLIRQQIAEGKVMVGVEEEEPVPSKRTFEEAIGSTEEDHSSNLPSVANDDDFAVRQGFFFVHLDTLYQQLSSLI